ncbi:GNAT family N-acetyltransferase [Methylobacterium planeticum]|uniref:GNAT family N-acetyltransferase n=1 Tax=Methylobacterium planeticum TaxID=2615211 RepID=A0A6N6MYK6_9HYPH|nr:GNAT family N-acetyltransferase [Methylobacterium planeticum]KAB1074432.1 GNAT family N-acetyltransferase [Methylobacterium planeticum]
MGSRYGLEIRTAVAADAPSLSALMEAAGHPVPAHALADRLDALRDGQGTALLALEWGPPSGIVVLHWYAVLDQDSPVAQVTLLLVGPEERRRGIGRQLLKAASQAARMAGCGVLQLLAPADQPSLLDFCGATGFVEAAGCFVRPLRKKG